MLGMGAYTPLDGFMGEADWRGCCEHMTLANGLFWPIPITLSCAQELGDSIDIGEDVALVDGETGELLGILTVEEKYAIDREFECSQVFRTTDPAHPGVDKVMSQGPVNLGGPVRTLVGRPFPGNLCRALPSPGRDAGDVSGKGLVEGGGLPDAQPDAPQP